MSGDADGSSAPGTGTTRTTSRPAPRAVAARAGRVVLLVSASMGSGHDHAAAELGRRLAQRGWIVRRVDYLDLGGPRSGRRLRATYRFVLRWVPALYAIAMWSWARWPRGVGWLMSRASRAARARERDLEKICREVRPTAVISLYNLASQSLGRLRAVGRIDVPVLTYVTDPGAHPYWVHPGVSSHLTVVEATAIDLEPWCGGRAQAVGSLVRPEFRSGPHREQIEARRRLGLPLTERLVLVSTGSWARGKALRIVAALLARTQLMPVVLCGRDERLHLKVQHLGGVAVDWIEDMPNLLRAMDVAVDDAGGLTCWEAMASGVPVLLHRVLPGHGRCNARTLNRIGAAVWVRSKAQLAEQASRLCEPGPSRSFWVRRAGRLVSGDPAEAIETALNGVVG